MIQYFKSYTFSQKVWVITMALLLLGGAYSVYVDYTYTALYCFSSVIIIGFAIRSQQKLTELFNQF